MKTTCKFCRAPLHLNRGAWCDKTQGDACPGNDSLENENQSHVPSAITRNRPIRGGAYNQAIWNAVNWDNADMAIARRLRCDRRGVCYQRRKRGVPPSKFPRGGSTVRGLAVYIEGKTPLPETIKPL